MKYTEILYGVGTVAYIVTLITFILWPSPTGVNYYIILGTLVVLAFTAPCVSFFLAMTLGKRTEPPGMRQYMLLVAITLYIVNMGLAMLIYDIPYWKHTIAIGTISISALPAIYYFYGKE